MVPISLKSLRALELQLPSQFRPVLFNNHPAHLCHLLAQPRWVVLHLNQVFCAIPLILGGRTLIVAPAVPPARFALAHGWSPWRGPVLI